MQIKNYIITGVICFFIGCIITGGISLYIFFKVGNSYEKDIADRDAIIKRIGEDLNSARATIDDLTKIRTEIEKSNTDALNIVIKLRNYQSEIRSGLESGIEKK